MDSLKLLGKIQVWWKIAEIAFQIKVSYFIITRFSVQTEKRSKKKDRQIGFVGV